MKVRTIIIFTMALILVCLGCTTTSLWAQTTGTLRGVVTDATGAVIPGATVVLTSESGERRTVTTDATGNYVAGLLRPGIYTMEISMKGFTTKKLEGIKVAVTEVRDLDARLEVSQTQETVTVTANAEILQTSTPTEGRVIEESTIRQLPLPTRNFQQLLTLSPGTISSLSNNTELGRGDTTISVNGQRTTSNDVRINGVDANSIGTNSTPNIATPATDSLQEFKVQTSMYDASMGRSAGGEVAAITKSGTNQYHGDVYEFFRNRILNANDFFLNTAGQPKPVLTRNQFGGTLGGPIIKDRTFFFVSYQGTRERNGASLSNSISSAFIDPHLTDANRTKAGLGAAFGLPAAAVSDVAVALLNAKLPNGQFAIPSASTPSGLTPISAVSQFREDQFNINIDHRISDRDSFSGKFFYATNPTFQALYSFAGLFNANQLPGFGGTLQNEQRLVSLDETHIFSPAVINVFRFGFSRLRVTSMPQEPFTNAQFGITNPIGSFFPGMSTMGVTGQWTIGSNAFADQSSRINLFQIGDTVSLTHGRHQIRIGGEARRAEVNFYFNAYSRGQMIFSSMPAFLLGVGVGILGSGVKNRALRTLDWAGFIQDDFKVTERFTLNVGLRYDLFGGASDIHGRLVNFIPSQFAGGTIASPLGPPNGFVQAGNADPGLPGVPKVDDTLIPNDKNNFAPRFGFAWQPLHSSRVVVRGGYGIYYDRTSTRVYNTSFLNYPYYSVAIAVAKPFSNPYPALPAPTQFPVSTTIPSTLPGYPPPFPASIAGVFYDPNFRTPYIQQYNLNIQWEPIKDYLLEVGYVGSKGTKLLQVLSFNQPIYTSTLALPVTPYSCGLAVPCLSAQKNITGGVQQVQSSGNAHYDSLQVSLTKRFSKGLQFLSSYTFANSIDDYSGSAINELFNAPGDQRNLTLDRGKSDFIRSQRFVTSLVYDLPKFADEGTKVGKYLTNHWQIATIVTLQSGLPFSVIESNGTSILSRANFAPGATAATAVTSGSVNSRLNNYINLGSFASSQQYIGTTPNPNFNLAEPYGTTGRNIFIGPDQRNMDFSIIKFFPMSEHRQLEFRTEFFNIFNTVNFAPPQANLATPSTFGKILSTASGPRVIQFALKYSF